MPVHKEAVVCSGAVLQGDVTVGDGSIIHPLAELRANGGAIVIGANCVVEERVQILSSAGSITSIGDFCHLEVYAVVQPGAQLGRGCLVECRGMVPEGCNLQAGCCVGVGAAAPAAGLTSNVLVYGTVGATRVVENSEAVNVEAVTAQLQASWPLLAK
mmetsp:Transcript_54377/g.124740  ORF Transcript_54377/g.124740 Transcript_54377/m.124740 type:complete len:158 (-) Transcript_54377:131-604(-)